MRRQRGSAYLFVVVCAAVMGITLAALIPLIAQSRTTENRRALAAKVDMTVSGLAEMVTSQANYSNLIVSSTQTLTLNGVIATATLSDGSSVVPNSYLLSGTATAGNGQTFKISRYVTQGSSSTPFSYAFYSATNMTYAGTIVTGVSGQDGNVFINGNASLNGSGTVINGNISAKGTISLVSGATVTGSKYSNAVAVTMPSISSLDYYNAAVYRASGTTTTSGVAFGNNSGPYPIYYLSGNCSLAGPISGQGVVFVQGNLTVTGNTTYSSSSDEIAMIVQGDVIFASGCTQAVGYAYATGNVVNQSSNLNITRGCLIGNAIPSASGTLQVTRDKFIINNSSGAYNLRLPGFWP